MPKLAEAIGGRERIIGGPFGSKLTQKDYTAHGIAVIRGSNMPDVGRRIKGPYAFVSEEKFRADLASNAAFIGDIIVTQRGTLGQVGIIDELSGHSKFVVSQSQMSARVDSRIACRDFVYYFLISSEFRQYVETVSIQTGVPHINLGILRDAPVSWPDIGEQAAIASVLRALDDKIELNRRTNETLEAMARAIFKDWFVDFGPTRAKMEGRPPYLAPDLWSLFPDRLDDETGLPERWKVSTIGAEVRVVGGSTPSTKEPDLWDGEINWATPKDLSTLSAPVLLATSRRITQAGLAKISSGLLPVGSVLLSSRAPIGYLSIAEVPVAINQGFIGMICEQHLSNVFVWLWTRENMDAILAKANGSTFQEISKSNFRPLPVHMPTTGVPKAFDAAALPIYRRIVQNEQETRTLTQTRNMLLPKLMSGEIRLRDAEKIAGEVL